MNGLIIGAIIFGVLAASVYSSDRWVPYFFPEENLASGTSTQTFNTATIAAQIHQLVNAERQKAGLAPLVWDDQLAAIAAEHSQNMMIEGFYDHTAPDGRTVIGRYAAAGYACATPGENLNQGGSYYGDYSEVDMVQNTVKSWMESPGHRENILRAAFDREGIGIAFNAAGDIAYITQNFC